MALWRLIEIFEQAPNEAAALMAAKDIVRLLKDAPLSVTLERYIPWETPHVATSRLVIASQGQKMGPVTKFEMKADKSGSTVSVTVPEIWNPRDSKDERMVRKIMEEDEDLAMKYDLQAEALTKVGVNVSRNTIMAEAEQP